jgi:hypothetical protein
VAQETNKDLITGVAMKVTQKSKAEMAKHHVIGRVWDQIEPHLVDGHYALILTEEDEHNVAQGLMMMPGESFEKFFDFDLPEVEGEWIPCTQKAQVS